MPYGVLGSQADQTAKNFGVFSVNDVADLEKQGKFGGSLELIQEINQTSMTSQVDMTSIKESEYDMHIVQLTNVKPENDNKSFFMRLSADGGSSFRSSDYNIAYYSRNTFGTVTDGMSTTYTAFLIGSPIGNNTYENLNCTMYLQNLGNSSLFSTGYVVSNYMDGNGYIYGNYGFNAYDGGAETHNALRFVMTQGDLTGNFKLYGYKEIT